VTLGSARDQQCSLLAQLTGLRELRVVNGWEVSAAGLRQLAALEQLTSLGLASLGWSGDFLREHMSDRLPGPCTYAFGIINKVSAMYIWGRGILFGGSQSLAPTSLLL